MYENKELLLFFCLARSFDPLQTGSFRNLCGPSSAPFLNMLLFVVIFQKITQINTSLPIHCLF